jgi:hypothetical protein
MFSISPRICLAFAVLASIFAQDGFAQTITLSPAAVPLSGTHGQSVTQTLTLQNSSDVEFSFVMQAQDVVVRDGARVFVEAGALPDSIAATAVFVPAEVTVPAHSNAVVKVTMTLPATLRHRAAVAFFRAAKSVQAGDQQALLSLGTLFTFALSDRVSVAAGALELTPPSATSDLHLQTRVTNDGDEPVVLAGTAAIVDAGGRLVGKVALPGKRLLPDETLTLAADYPGEVAPGSYRVVATLDAAGRPVTLSAALDVR